MSDTPEGLNMPSKLPKRPYVFAWDMHYSCNFRCPYCFYTDANWTEIAKRNQYRAPEDWEEAWGRVAARYGRCQIRVTAGEPFTYPGFGELVEKLTEHHDVQVTTNCSYTDAMRRFTERVDPSRVELDCTFHPLQADFDQFLSNVLLLRQAGFTANVCYLAYTPQMDAMAEFKERFRRAGVYMNLAMHWGEYKGVQYPQGYTPEQRSLIKTVAGSGWELETVNLEPIDVRGKRCAAGQRYAVVQTDGRVFRCGQLAREHQSIGSLFDPDFALFEKGRPCESDFCRCKEFQSAWDEDDKAELVRKSRELNA